MTNPVPRLVSLLAVIAATGVSPADVARACPPAPLTAQVAHAARIVLARAVDRTQPAPADADCTCSCPSPRVTFDVLETWKGEPLENLTLEDDAEVGQTKVLFLTRAEGEGSGTDEWWQLRAFSPRGPVEIRALQELLGRALSIANEGDEDEEARHRLGVDALRLRETRFDGLVLVGWGPTALSPVEARDLDAWLVEDPEPVEALPPLLSLVGCHASAALRERIAQVVDEAAGEIEPRADVEGLVRWLESGPAPGGESPRVVEEEPAERVEPADPVDPGETAADLTEEELDVLVEKVAEEIAGRLSSEVEAANEPWERWRLERMGRLSRLFQEWPSRREALVASRWPACAP